MRDNAVRRMMLMAAALVLLAGPVAAQKAGDQIRSYDAQGRRTGTIERRGERQWRSYDARGRLEGAVECRGSTCTRYDAQGRRIGRIERR